MQSAGRIEDLELLSNNFVLPFCYNVLYGNGAIPGQEFRTREFLATFF